MWGAILHLFAKFTSLKVFISIKGSSIDFVSTAI